MTIAELEAALVNERRRKSRARMARGVAFALVVLVTAIALVLPGLSMTQSDLPDGGKKADVSLTTSAEESDADVDAVDLSTAAEESEVEGLDVNSNRRNEPEASDNLNTEESDDPNADDGYDAANVDEAYDGSDAPDVSDEIGTAEDDTSSETVWARRAARENGENGADGSGEPDGGNDDAAAEDVSGDDGGAGEGDAVDDDGAGGGGGAADPDASEADDGAGSEDESASDEGASEGSEGAADSGSEDSNSSEASTPNPEMPAQTFTDDLKNRRGDVVLSVSVEAPEGALPANATMKLEQVMSPDVEKAVDEAVAKRGAGEVSEIQVVDISFTTEEGETVEPAEKVTVKVASELIANNDAPLVVNVNSEGDADVVGTLSESELEERNETLADDELMFDSDELLTVGIVVTTIEKSVLASDGHNYTISVSYGSDAGVPKNSELVVEELTGEYEGYEDYVAKTESALGWTQGTATYARLFDISIVDPRGEKVEVTAPVSVEIKLADMNETGDRTQVVHFAEEDEPEVVEGIDAQASEDGCALAFETSGFSVYAIVDAPQQEVIEPNAVKDLAELAEGAGQAGSTEDGAPFYLSVNRGTASNYYFKNSLNTVGCFELSENDPLMSSKWYFESVEGNTYRIYTYVGDEKSYVKNVPSNGNYVGLVNGASDADVFEISGIDDEGNGPFYFKIANKAKWLQYSKSGSGIRFWNDIANTGNSRITITHAPQSGSDKDPYELDGKTYGIAYQDNRATSAALTAQSERVGGQNRLDALPMVMKPDVLDNEGILLVAEGSDIQEWTFEAVGFGGYRIFTEVDGAKKYLSMSRTGVTLEENPTSNSSVFQLVPGADANSGKWSMSANGYFLSFASGNDIGYNGKTTADDTSWLNFVTKSNLSDDDFVLHSAKKVSVSDLEQVPDGAQVIIYTRLWNETKKKYEFYAVDYDGSLIYCYDAGDNIEWIGSTVNTAIWDFTEYHYDNSDDPNYYYELQNVYADQAGRASYIAPQLKGNQILSSKPIGVNLNGRRYGQGYTSIVAWDDYNYAYAGLKAKDGHLVAWPVNDRKDPIDDFYFAIMNPPQGEDPAMDELTTVKTLDSKKYGISMTMVDFNNRLSGDRDSRQKAFMGTKTGKGLLTTNLNENGYPEGTSEAGEAGRGQPLSNLFYADNGSGGPMEVNHLFLESIYNESGYFEYDSTQNFAHLNTAGANRGNFTVYDQLGGITGNGEHKPTREHGLFMPYNEIEKGKFAIDKDGKIITNQTDVLAQPLPDTDARKGEKLYTVGSESTVDYFFGMEMSAEFTQTPSGLDAWKHDIIFEFSGDDDFWLYVDGELILDLGGIHSAQVGSVNFRTGLITSSNGDSTLYDTFRSNYVARGLSEDEINENLGRIFTLNEEGNYVFTDYSQHEMKMFYMERGAGSSNLHMRFNLAAVEPGTFVLSKELDGVEETSNNLIEFPYQVYYYDKNDLEHKTPILLEEKTDGKYNVLYNGTGKNVKYAEEFTPKGGETYEHVFFLKPGQKAQVRLPEENLDYYVVECGVKPAIYDHVYANGDELEGNPMGGSGVNARNDYATETASLKTRKSVDFVNHVAPGAMRTLSITKRLYDSDGETLLHGESVEGVPPFTFRLYLGDENCAPDKLPAADMYEYLVKDPSGNYCRWDASRQTFVAIEPHKTSYDDLTEEERLNYTYNTSMYGTSSKIPVDHTIEVRNLIVSTQYRVEERDEEIPRGYTRRIDNGYARLDLDPKVEQNEPFYGIIGEDDVPEGDGSGEEGADGSETAPVDVHDPVIEVRNQIGWGLTVKKVWSDKDFMRSHDDIYLGVYLGDKLVEGSVKQMTTTDADVYYFFRDLYDDEGKTHSFSEYVVREVTISAENPIVDASGTVQEPGTVTPIEPSGKVKIGGEPTIGAVPEGGFEYTVKYNVGDPTGRNENVRIDTVTNSRPGIELYKTDTSGNPLSGARFTLVNSAGKDTAHDAYITGTDGLITIAYLPSGTYTLTETAAPSDFIALPGPLTIKVGEDGTVSVGGVDESLYEINHDNPDMLATIKVKNRTSGLQLRKVDLSTGQGLKGVHFALYPQVTNAMGVPQKAFLPLSGYEDIVTGDNGILAEIAMSLGPGTYFLEEKKTLPNYDMLTGDLCFTITEGGTVRIETEGRTGWLVERSEPGSSTVSYIITVPNGKMNSVRFKKVDQTDPNTVLDEAKFTMTTTTVGNNGQEITHTYTLRSTKGTFEALDSEGNPTENLPAGIYTITETDAPDGYLKMDGVVTLTVLDSVDAKSPVTYTQLDNGGGEPRDAQLITDDPTHSNPYYLVTITNRAGMELPHTGGAGTAAIYIVGALMVLGSAVVLFVRRRRA